MGTEASPPQTPVSERCAYCGAPLPVELADAPIDPHPRVASIDAAVTARTPISAAIAAQLAKGKSLAEAVTIAHAYLQGAIHGPLQVAGLNCIRHL